jgi:autotransporter-associated beta strand protein
MAGSWWRRLQGLLGGRCESSQRRPARIQPRLELLEGRLVPAATRIWDGGAVLNDRWTDARNWVGNVAPVAGDNVEFPAGIGALDRTTNNDFPAGTLFNSIIFSGDDYTLSGNAVTLGSGLDGGIVSGGSAVSNAIELDLILQDTDQRYTFDIAAGQLVNVFGGISGGGVLFKDGNGNLAFAGASPHSYLGGTSVEAGTLSLAKPAGVTAIPNSDPFESLVIINPNARLILLNSNQIADGAALILNETAQFLMLNNSSETFAGLSLRGVTVNTGGGTLTITNSISSVGSPNTARLEGKLKFSAGSPHAISVADGAAGNDLIVAAQIAGAGFEKIGAGSLILSGNNTYTGTAKLSAGSMRIEGNQPTSDVLATGGVLGGLGTVGVLQASGAGIVNPGSFGVAGTLTAEQLFLQAGSTLVIDVGPTGVDRIHNSDFIPQLATFPVLDVHLNVRSRVGDVLTIVQNDASDKANGRFKDPTGLILNEGTTFSVDGQAFQITYSGGDGNDIVITHVNTPPMFQNRQVTSPVGEGGQATVTGTIVEPDTLDTFFLDVTWGDGSAAQTFKFLPGTPRNIDVSHRYVDDGDYTINLLWRDQHGAFNTGTLAVHVDNVAPRLGDLAISSPVVSEQRTVLTGSIVDPGRRDTFSLLIDWGDGTPPETIQLHAGSERFTLTHRYSTPGHYKVSLTLTDDDGGQDTDAIGVKVRP